MNTNNHYPKISIVTPSYNQGRFIEDTILSVLGQQYPNLEYIIIDGGSTDETVSIIKKYESQITYWISEKDSGQSNAINKGFAMATGEILGWLNSDDLYMPGTLRFVSDHLNAEGEELIFGNCLHFSEQGGYLSGRGSNVKTEHQQTDLSMMAYVIQPSSFWSKKTWEKTGILREDLHFGFDWEWFLRARQAGVKFQSHAKCLSMYRIHEAHKTGSGGAARQKELYRIYQQYAGEKASAYLALASETLDQRTLPLRVFKRILSFVGKQAGYGDILKMFKPGKYKAVSAKEINELANML